jgi:hypothetical protein
MTDIHKCKLFELPKIFDTRGSLTSIESYRQVPFQIQRVYYIYDVPDGSQRGGHAHKELEQLIVALSGSFDVILDDGYKKKRFHLNQPNFGIYICPFIWRELENFSLGSVCTVMASRPYEEDDYIRDYKDYLLVRASS